MKIDYPTRWMVINAGMREDSQYSEQVFVLLGAGKESRLLFHFNGVG